MPAPKPCLGYPSVTAAIKVSRAEMTAFLVSDGSEWKDRERQTRCAQTVPGYGISLWGTTPAEDALFRGVEVGRDGWPVLS